MSGNSTYLATEFFEWLMGTNMPAAPADLYVALFDGDPTDAGSGGTEVTNTITGTNRIIGSFVAAGKGIENDAIVDFGTAVAGADVTHWALFDADTAGNMLYSWPLTTPKTVTTGDPVTFPIGDLSITEISAP